MATILNQHSGAEPERPAALSPPPAPKTRFPSVGKYKLRPYIALLSRISAFFLGALHIPSLMKRLAWLGNVGQAVLQGAFLSGVPTNRTPSSRERFPPSTCNLLPGSEHPQQSRLVRSPPTRQALLRSNTRHESSGIAGRALCMRSLNGTCPTHDNNVRVMGFIEKNAVSRRTAE